ncbi:copper chaperone PCu(A)C [Glutamicibacter sp. MNS18]|uniref:copper chaperone PCu(A)C n=1 Tax=Glutamicibacter sp. MNS18 TaxID=2989817 RepID=UPI002235C0D7|nr:copper chaperone PCu(A)C [Glutamicibacter sp. MNS18]MCW4463935.1 copper chaperone PCu(A)C [Glutamicibacter sp. MNS18]
MIFSKKTTKTLGALALGSGLLLTGCAQGTDSEAAVQPDNSPLQADALQVTESWAKAADSGMSAAFAMLNNVSELPVELESVTEKDHGTTMEIHEMDGEGTDMVMQQIDGPLLIDAGHRVELAPGGNHIMYMDLSEPLVPAETSTLTLNFSDGSSKDVDFAIRNYDGANESYHGDGEHADHAEQAEHGEGGH